MKKKISEMPIEKVYIVVLAVLGFLYMIFMPPFRVSDEYRHFNRAYEVTMGQIVSQNESPRGSEVLAEGETKYSTVWNNRDINMQENRSKMENTVASGYSPVSYLPASIGIFVARFFSGNRAARSTYDVAGNCYNVCDGNNAGTVQIHLCILKCHISMDSKRAFCGDETENLVCCYFGNCNRYDHGNLAVCNKRGETGR